MLCWLVHIYVFFSRISIISSRVLMISSRILRFFSMAQKKNRDHRFWIIFPSNIIYIYIGFWLAIAFPPVFDC